MTKKILIFLGFCLMLFPSINVAAQEVVQNEYDIIIQYKGKTIDELRKLGFSLEEATEIHNLESTVKSTVYEAGRLSDEELEKQGYSKQQILAIRNLTNQKQDKMMKSNNNIYDNSDNNFLMRAKSEGLFADVIMNCYKDFSYESTRESDFNDNIPGGTHLVHRMRYYWEWDGLPLVKLQDAIAFAWAADSTTIMCPSSHIYANAYDINGRDIEIGEIVLVPGTGWGHKTKGGVLTDFPTKGEGTFCLIDAKKDNVDLHLIYEYGHKTVKATGISIDIKGTPSIGFGWGTETMCSHDKYIDLRLN